MKVVANVFVLRMDLGKHVHSARSTAVQRDLESIGRVRRNRLECHPKQTHPADIRGARPAPAPIAHHTCVATLNNSTTFDASDDPFNENTLIRVGTTIFLPKELPTGG
jgi:hypothetical protein